MGPSHSPGQTKEPRGSPVRVAVWVLHLSLPLLGLWLLLARPELDVRWQHNPSHFWLVVGVAAVNVVLGGRIARESSRRDDARLFLVAMAFLVSAGFLGLHALATPAVILPGPNAGFEVATPLGLFIASGFAAVSAIDLGPRGADAILRRRRVIQAGVVAILVGWGAVSLGELPPLRDPLPAEGGGFMTIVSGAGVVGYAGAAIGYFRIHRRRPAVLLVSLITAFALLAEALVATTYARNWQASWWEWHVLMAAAFGFVAYSAHVRYRLEGSATALFNSISLEETVRSIREELGRALEALTDTMRRAADEGREDDVGPIARRLGQRFELTEGQTDVLERAASSLAAERALIDRLAALVELGSETHVLIPEDELLERAVGLVGERFGRDAVRLGVVSDGVLRFPPALAHGTASTEDPGPADAAIDDLEPVETDSGDGATMAIPLVVKGHGAGVLEVRRPRGAFSDRERWLLRSLATQLAIAVENVRLYGRLDVLFRTYLSPAVATTLIADPEQAALGGGVVEVTILFADLRGFTTFSERTPPTDVVDLLNRYFATAVPEILAEQGTMVSYVGDALMAMWNAPSRQSDHAPRACRAALAMQRAIASLVPDDPEAPRFRVGINTGPAVVGNIGSEEVRSYTAIGDTVNLASRLEGQAEPGQVVIGSRTHELVREVVVARSLGPLQVKGRAEPEEAYVLEGFRP